MRIAALALAASLITLIHAQQVDWLTSAPVAYTMNPGMPDQVLTSAPGYLVGERQMSGVFNYGNSLYGAAVLEMLDPTTGVQNWSCQLFDSVKVGSAAVSADGMAYFAGSFMGQLVLCDGSILGGQQGAPVWNENLFLIAVDLNTGLLAWTRNLSLTYDQESMNTSLAIDPEGNLWYTIEEWGVGRVVRVDANGDDLETRIIDGVRVFGTISFDPWGGLYASGSADNSGFAFGGQGYQNYGTTGYSMFVLRFRPDGTAGFAEFADDVTFHNPTVVATSDGHAYLAGDMLMEGTNWGGIPFNGPDWVYAMFLTELDSTGQFLWGIESDPAGGTITGDIYRAKGPCIAVDGSNNVYLMGTLRGTVDWGNGVVSNGLTIGAQTMTIVAFTPNGTPQWAATSMPGGMFNESRTLTAMAEPNVVHFAGHLTADFTFPPINTNIGGAQAAMVGRLDGLSTGVREVLSSGGLSTWPNPTTTALNIDVQGTTVLIGELLNGAGQRVRMITLRPGHNTIDVGGLPSGIYLLRAGDGRSLRVVKE
ncbi:MAG: T9SS type A sorting domain-containing protein [Flavobacteriales bacterium]|nr:T9SS type A sorting domain-containing protein [Flavobacteriales bacterium]